MLKAKDLTQREQKSARGHGYVEEERESQPARKKNDADNWKS
jgi:hypothetical protein